MHQQRAWRPILTLATILSHTPCIPPPSPIKISYLGNTSDIFVPILLTEPQILVQSKAHIIAIESVRIDSQVEEVLFQSGRDCGFAGGGEPGEPEGEAALLGVGLALGAGETFVPGDVAGTC